MSLISNSIDDVANHKCTRLSGKCCYANGEQSAKPSPLAISKEARKTAFDKRRSKSIAAAVTCKKNGPEKRLKSDSDESSDSEDEYSDDESGFSSEESSDGEQFWS